VTVEIFICFISVVFAYAASFSEYGVTFIY
jgi:hypothetical protein